MTSNMKAPERKLSHKEMEGIGLNMGEVDKNTLAIRRMKKGECPTCGARTHKVGFFGKRTALTIEGQCLYGRCLLCNPVEGYGKRPPEPNMVPRTIEAKFPYHEDILDDGTMVSGITMDHRLIVGERNWNGEVPDEEGMFEEEDHNSFGSDDVAPNRQRPDASVGGDDFRPRRPLGRDGSLLPAAGEAVIPPNRRQYSSSLDMHMDRVGKGIGTDIDDLPVLGRGASGGRKFSRPGTVNENASTSGRSDFDRHTPRDLNSDGNEWAAAMPEEQYAGNLTLEQNVLEEKINDGALGSDPHLMESADGLDAIAGQGMITSLERSVSRNGARITEFEDSAEFPAPDFGSESVTSSNISREGQKALVPFPTAAFDEANSTPDENGDRLPQLSMKQSAGLLPSAPSTRHLMEAEKDMAMNSEVEEPNATQAASTKPTASGGVGASSNITVPSQAIKPARVPDFSESFSDSRSIEQDFLSPSRGRRRLPVKPPMPKKKLPEISVILNNMDDETDRAEAFMQMAEIIQQDGQKAKLKFQDFYGMETLLESMWEDMGKADVQASACDLLLALASSRDGSQKNDVMVGTNAEGAVDALLFVMQTHSGVERIQKSGISALYCLAVSSSNNNKINDGSLSGAVLTVVNAMEAHKSSSAVAELGIRALYALCVQSVHSESNKTNLALTKLDSGTVGVSTIPRVASKLLTDMVACEWICRLYWCLTTNEDIVSVMSHSRAHTDVILRSMQQFYHEQSSAPMMEAGFGTLANFARLERNHAALLEDGVLGFVIDAMQRYVDHEGVVVEACILLANLSQTMAIKTEIVENDGVSTLSKCMWQHVGNESVLIEATGALLTLSHGSKSAKVSLSNDATLRSIGEVLRDRESSSVVVERICTLLASICMTQQTAASVVTTGVFDALLWVIKERRSEKKVLEAATLSLRNTISYGEGFDLLSDAENIEILVQTMDDCADSEAVQKNACATLWNLSLSVDEPSGIVDAGGIEQIVKAMQSHMESSEVLELACGALWSMTLNSNERKKKIVDSGGIDAITCALVMHPTDPSTLEMACGVLSCISVNGATAAAVSESQGISMIVEAMRSNNDSLRLLELGILVLRNIVLANPRYANDASNGISTIINAMREHPSVTGVQIEACNALWAMAAESEDCKSKILALDGVTIVMESLDRNSNVEEIEAAARGAINQLAMSGTKPN